MNFNQTLDYLKEKSISFFECISEIEFKSRYEKSYSIYVIKWKKQDVFNWGTMSPNNNRIRLSSIFNNKLTGKYDRRVDYLMLKKIFGLEKVIIFKFNTRDETLIHERKIKTSKNQLFCFSGIDGENRHEISKNIYKSFVETKWFKSFEQKDKKLFDEFFSDVFLGKLRHPKNPKRTFYYGDCLEPKFLVTINKEYLEDSVEKVLDVRFY